MDKHETATRGKSFIEKKKEKIEKFVESMLFVIQQNNKNNKEKESILSSYESKDGTSISHLFDSGIILIEFPNLKYSFIAGITDEYKKRYFTKVFEENMSAILPEPILERFVFTKFETMIDLKEEILLKEKEKMVDHLTHAVIDFI